MARDTQIKGGDYCVERLRAMARDTGADFLAEIIRAGRLCAVSCARSTQPYGNDAAAHNLGKAAVEKDIRKLFVIPTSMYAILKLKSPALAAKFWKARSNSNSEAMRQALVEAGYNLQISLLPTASIHDSARDAKGHVKSRGARQMVTEAGALAAYIRIRQKRVGFAKAGWSRAAEQCGGTRGIPAWASSQQPAAQGSAVVHPDPLKPKVTLSNTVRYIDGLISPGEIQKAIGIAYDRLFKQLSFIAKKPRKLAA